MRPQACIWDSIIHRRDASYECTIQCEVKIMFMPFVALDFVLFMFVFLFVVPFCLKAQTIKQRVEKKHRGKRDGQTDRSVGKVLKCSDEMTGDDCFLFTTLDETHTYTPTHTNTHTSKQRLI